MQLSLFGVTRRCPKIGELEMTKGEGIGIQQASSCTSPKVTAIFCRAVMNFPQMDYSAMHIVGRIQTR